MRWRTDPDSEKGGLNKISSPSGFEALRFCHLYGSILSLPLFPSVYIIIFPALQDNLKLHVGKMIIKSQREITDFKTSKANRQVAWGLPHPCPPTCPTK